MKAIFIFGFILTGIGLLGFLKCVSLGLRIKRLEKSGFHKSEELKALLGNFSVINMISLSCSMLGLIIIIIVIILD